MIFASGTPDTTLAAKRVRRRRWRDAVAANGEDAGSARGLMLNKRSMLVIRRVSESRSLDLIRIVRKRRWPSSDNRQDRILSPLGQSMRDHC